MLRTRNVETRSASTRCRLLRICPAVCGLRCVAMMWPGMPGTWSPRMLASATGQTSRSSTPRSRPGQRHSHLMPGSVAAYLVRMLHHRQRRTPTPDLSTRLRPLLRHNDFDDGGQMSNTPAAARPHPDNFKPSCRFNSATSARKARFCATNSSTTWTRISRHHAMIRTPTPA